MYGVCGHRKDRDGLNCPNNTQVGGGGGGGSGMEARVGEWGGGRQMLIWDKGCCAMFDVCGHRKDKDGLNCPNNTQVCIIVCGGWVGGWVGWGGGRPRFMTMATA
jgi:hypothetical protein